MKEYLLSDRCAFRSDFRILACHQQIAEGCLRYLLYLSGHIPLSRKVVDQYPMAQYAAKYWWQHALEIDEMLGCIVLDLASRLLVDEDGALLSWIQLYNADTLWRDLNLSLTDSQVAQPLYYAASVGVSEVVKEILRPNLDISTQGGQYGNTLQAASRWNHKNVMQMLLDAGAENDESSDRSNNKRGKIFQLDRPLDYPILCL